MQPLFGHHVPTSADEFFEVQDKLGRKPGKVIRPHVDQEIDVTVRSGFAPRCQSGKPDAAGSVPRGGPKNMLSFGLQVLNNSHIVLELASCNPPSESIRQAGSAIEPGYGTVV